jgi:hypothetical protein
MKAKEDHEKLISRLLKVEKPGRSEIWRKMAHAWDMEKASRGLQKSDKAASQAHKRQKVAHE